MTKKCGQLGHEGLIAEELSYCNFFYAGHYITANLTYLPYAMHCSTPCKIIKSLNCCESIEYPHISTPDYIARINTPDYMPYFDDFVSSQYLKFVSLYIMCAQCSKNETFCHFVNMKGL